MDKIEQLHSIIDELRIESRKIEYGSALNRLTKRVENMETDITSIKTILKELCG
jgi:hypothetical protein